jgi:hypothetical protein
MRNETGLTEVGRDYRDAYAAHYMGRDLPGALRLYSLLVASYPQSPEAAYSRSQVENIVKSVVPLDVLLDAHLKLARAHMSCAAGPESGHEDSAKPLSGFPV